MSKCIIDVLLNCINSYWTLSSNVIIKLRNSAVNDLLQIGLIVNQRVDTLQEPELVAEIKGQLKNGGLVDYLEHLNPSDFNVLWSIIQTEVKAREKKYILK